MSIYADRKVATVFGGTGFIGRHIVAHLARQNYTIRVVTRFRQSAYDLRTNGSVGQIVPIRCDYKDFAGIERAVSGSVLVINCIGQLFETRKKSFARAHAELPAQIAKACRAMGVDRFVHISALGCDKNQSRYAQTKHDGEASVLKEFPRATILRPSVVFGAEDNFFNKFAAMSVYLPFLPLIGGGETRFQPVYVGDVANAAVMAATLPDTGPETPCGKIYELGGPEVMNFKDIYAHITRHTGRKIRGLNLPLGLARLQASLFSLLPGVPILTNDQITLLQTDNILSGNLPGFRELKLIPTSVDSVLPLYLARFRTGGRLENIKKGIV